MKLEVAAKLLWLGGPELDFRQWRASYVYPQVSSGSGFLSVQVLLGSVCHRIKHPKY